MNFVQNDDGYDDFFRLLHHMFDTVFAGGIKLV